jgi:hypothetical protein
VPAAWEEVLAGSPSARRISILFTGSKAILVVEEGSTGRPEEDHRTGRPEEDHRIGRPEEDRSSYDMGQSRCESKRRFCCDLRLLGLLGVVVGHVGCDFRRSDGS